MKSIIVGVLCFTGALLITGSLISLYGSYCLVVGSHRMQWQKIDSGTITVFNAPDGAPSAPQVVSAPQVLSRNSFDYDSLTPKEQDCIAEKRCEITKDGFLKLTKKGAA